MPDKIRVFLEQLEQVRTLESLHHLVLFSARLFDSDHAIYHSVKGNEDAFALATYSPEWAKHYETEKLYLADPVVLNSFRSFSAYEWKSLDWSAKSSRRLVLDAGDGGVGNQGLSIPIRGPDGEVALYSINKNANDTVWAAFVARETHNLMLVAHYIHAASRRIRFNSEAGSYVNLSPREVDSLTLLGLGKNRARIAEFLNISEHTLRVYIESARVKLGATNTINAVALATNKGLISF